MPDLANTLLMRHPSIPPQPEVPDRPLILAHNDQPDRLIIKECSCGACGVAEGDGYPWCDRYDPGDPASFLTPIQ